MEFNSLKKPAIILSIMLIAIVFVLFNLSSTAEISFMFVKLGQVPLLMVVLLSFALGAVFTFFLFYKGMKSKKDKKEKKEEKEDKKKDEEKKDKEKEKE